MNWGQYLARGIVPTSTSVPSTQQQQQQPQHEIIYHMCVRKDYEDQIQNGSYYPPTYHQDGFIHATDNPNLLLSIGTHFYKSDINDWICLGIDVKKLRSPVKYEPAAPVGSTASHDTNTTNLFPHIYGSINPESVCIQYNIIRSLDGTFHSIDGLVDGITKISLA